MPMIATMEGSNHTPSSSQMRLRKPVLYRHTSSGKESLYERYGYGEQAPRQIPLAITDKQDRDVPEDVDERLASAFSGELIRGLCRALDDWNGRTILHDALGDILKEFSIRCQGSACTKQQKDAATFVRHYRQ